ncbi:exodeoxyribonuclease V subunit alpha [Nocardioides sp. Root122]|uniref:exodeoxyribonuclease V subunit alpha n=1 Tax=Nocardioides TaxID=1839 RepID=UPI0007031A19|nr:MULTISPECIES: exodeoxyribonuclease V subunit alpha [Nocardioides]KQV63257.1 exodeoxyribonuclease V subunit alpha [Nocardioides sp. Root122]MCK9824370.1 exodeoxyribonuclease V subunit alpha [Nocardioides cavernae]
MTDLFEPVDATDARLALGATGLLAHFNAAGVLTSADVHVASALGRLGRETDEQVLLAVALAVRAVRGGSVALDLTTVADPPGLPWPDQGAWTRAVADSPLVEMGLVRWDNDLLYLDRYHEQETQVVDDLLSRAATSPDHDAGLMAASMARLVAAMQQARPGTSYDEQVAACLAAAGQWTTVLTGGPGTGKTTAVASLLVGLLDQHPDGLRIALAAPTGKAAARLQQAVHQEAEAFDEPDRARLAGVTASTLHRLLRPDPGNSTRFRHHRGNRLPHDVVVVDESSMVSLTHMARLLEAVRPDARLVLVGDPHQLSSVEAGAVLSDVVRGFQGRADSPVAGLRTTHRFGEQIRALAEALRTGDADEAVAVLSAGHDAVEWVDEADPAPRIRTTALTAALAVRDAAERGDVAGALAALDRHRLLCAHRDGPYGVRHWNRRIEHWLTAETGDPLHERAYIGRPLLVTANDHQLGVYNGDSGVVVRTPEGPRAVIAASDGPRDLAPSRLGDVETMHAMTIHKSQGSQADVVTVLLPDEDSRLLSRELFYTAVTRARSRVRVVGSEAAIRAAIGRRAQRASGLAVRLAAAP